MRLALIGAVRTETVGLLSLVGGLMLFLMGYVTGAQTHPVTVAPPVDTAPVAQVEAPPAAVIPAAECPTPAAAPVEPQAAPAVDWPPSVVSPRRVRTKIIKDSPR